MNRSYLDCQTATARSSEDPHTWRRNTPTRTAHVLRKPNILLTCKPCYHCNMQTPQEPMSLQEFAWICGRADGLIGTVRKRSAEGELQELGAMMRTLLREVARLRPDLDFEFVLRE